MHFQGRYVAIFGASSSWPSLVLQPCRRMFRDGLQALWHSTKFEMAEPGAEFQVTDNIMKPNLPIRRLILAGCSVDHCIIYYERGGVAHTYTVVLFQTKGAVRFEWGGAAPRDLVDLAQVKAAVLSGTIRGGSKNW